MDESREISHLQQKKKSKKINKSYNLLDFVVVKKKKKKTQEIRKVRIAKAIRGKARKKKLTTVKKRILNERKEKKSSLEVIQEGNEDVTEEANGAADGIEIVAQVDQNEDKSKDADDKSENLCQVLEVLNVSQNKITEESNNTSSNSVQHSRNFREYCNHFLTPEIKLLTEKILKDLFKFQENKFQQNPGTQK